MGDASRYLEHLPAVLRGDPSSGRPAEGSFLDLYLRVFEAFLSGREDTPSVRSLEGGIAEFPEALDPGRTPPDFLRYLASWVGLDFDENWSLEKKRLWLERIVPLYKRRGTKQALSEYLAVFVGHQARILEPPGGFELADPDSSTLGETTFLGGPPAYFFQVRIRYGFDEPFENEVFQNLVVGTRTIVDREKPAHTYYELDVRTPGFILGEAGHSELGETTLLWRDNQPD